ncbi:F0F1 ATP synthase subunit epsilon [Ancylobacter mangrovi]|uniref:F0F1 ATP synthase subunit epsilon n=1 Tax=Ancylobacter mangrovi TaxID=2972472 RepID=UPI0021639CEC|nr:F0F1 ATP synthase subunit epsilon [Ancylobacter mangrovi]MCS0503473.1 F0F1 ATP synthase subunit epsilon [Ancylobacter mangrovi]
MSRTIHLTITTPSSVLVDRADVVSVRAEDESGGFGILPGHADFLTVLPASVVRWRGPDQAEHFCVVGGGVLTVTGGRDVSLACRQGTVGDDLGALEADVATMRAADTDADRRARTEQLRLHAHAVRQLMRYLRPGQTGNAEAILGEAMGEEAS